MFLPQRYYLPKSQPTPKIGNWLFVHLNVRVVKQLVSELLWKPPLYILLLCGYLFIKKVIIIIYDTKESTVVSSAYAMCLTATYTVGDDVPSLPCTTNPP